jgi:hypothetical protein
MYLGDNLLKGENVDFIKDFLNSKVDASLPLTEVENSRQYGVTLVDEQKKNIVKLVEKPKNPPSNLSIVGIYCLTPKIFEAIENIKPSWRRIIKNTDALHRLIQNDLSLMRRVLNAGAAGIIVSMIYTSDESVRAVDAVRYSPEWKRSYGLGRAQKFGLNFDTYIHEINKTSIVVIQIEHKDALANPDTFLTVPGIDAIVISPYDLSGSMGIPGTFDDPAFSSALTQIINNVKHFPVALGIHIVHLSEQDLNERIPPKIYVHRVWDGYDILAEWCPQCCS